jgi:D-arabinose 5-phosphate isomerase GutQ
MVRIDALTTSQRLSNLNPVATFLLCLPKKSKNLSSRKRIPMNNPPSIIAERMMVRRTMLFSEFMIACFLEKKFRRLKE